MQPFPRRLLSMAWFGALALLLAGCVMTPQGFLPIQLIPGSGEVETVEVDVGRFSRLEIRSAFDVTVRQGDTHRVVIEIDTALVPHLVADTRNDTLEIGLDDPIRVSGNPAMRAEIVMPDLRGLTTSGASHVDLAGFESAEDLTIGASGASRIEAEIDAGATRITASGASQLTLTGQRGDVNITASGASRVTLSGRGENASAQASGASNIDLADFPVEDADVNASGASSITVNANGRLDTSASGASTIYYLGDPTMGAMRTSGGSSVRPR